MLFYDSHLYFLKLLKNLQRVEAPFWPTGILSGQFLKRDYSFLVQHKRDLKNV